MGAETAAQFEKYDRNNVGVSNIGGWGNFGNFR